MLTKEEIYPLISPKLVEKALFLVDLKVDLANNITLELDSISGINISECAEVNRYLESQLDREKEDYSITVSSPGISSPFKVKEQYLKNVGRKVDVKTTDGHKFSGILESFTAEGITLEAEVIEKIGKKKKKSTIHQHISHTNIKETKKVISFKRI